MPKEQEEKMIETSLYDGRLKIRHDPEANTQRYYIELDGKNVTGWSSPSAIVGIKDKSSALVSWATELAQNHLLEAVAKKEKITPELIVKACNLHEERKEEAADIGTITHDWVEHHIKSVLGKGEHPDMPEDPRVIIGVNAWMEFEEAHKIKYHSVERIVASLKNKFTGRLDIDATIDSKRGLLDLKTSNGLYNGVRMQTAMYVKADEEEKGKDIFDVRWAIRVAKETEEEYLVRMEQKNKNRELRGKSRIVYPAYQVFEAKNLDEDGYRIDEDYKAAMSAYHLLTWDRKTDFYLEQKNNK